MAKTFTEVFNEIKEGVSTTKSGKPMQSWSRDAFDKLAKAYVNEVDYTILQASAKGDSYVTKEVKPVQLLRSMIQRILIDFGVDKAEAERVMTEAYEITKVDGIYELCSELIYQYMDTGKKFDFITREDFAGSLVLKEVGESVSDHKHPTTHEVTRVKKEKHKVLEKKSKTPQWLKSKVK